MSVTDYSKTASSNTSIGGNDVSEGCSPAGINNAIRQIAADIAEVVDGTTAMTAFAVDNLKMDGNTLSSTDTNGNITLAPNGTGEVNLADSDKLTLGNSSDLEIYHDGSNSYIKDAGTGVLKIQGSGQVLIEDASGNVGAAFNANTDVALKYAGSNKLVTTSTGVSVTGDLSVSGSISGAGKVLQVVTAVDSTNTNVTSSSDVTVHSVTITPSSTSNKVLILASYTGYIGGAASTERFIVTLKRGTTVLADSEMYRDSGRMKAVPSQFNHLDSPSSTSAVTYNITIRRQTGSEPFGWCEQNREAVLTALEISA
jgi:hypothetical protein